MAKNISISQIKRLKNKFLKNNKNTASRNALIKNDLANVALNWENFSQIEFSQNYFMFCDKLEKANYFLENIIKSRDKSYESRLITHLLKAPVQDGGQWDMFVNLINKYGAVPKDEMPETYHSSKSGAMNYILTHKLREFASILRANSFLMVPTSASSGLVAPITSLFNVII